MSTDASRSLGEKLNEVRGLFQGPTADSMKTYKDAVAGYRSATGISKSQARSNLEGSASTLISKLEYAGSMLEYAAHETRPSPSDGQSKLDFYVKSCTDAMAQYTSAIQATGSSWDPRAVRVASLLASDTCNAFKAFLQSATMDELEEVGGV